MEITASMVKALRESTGAGMMDCKQALTEAGGDLDKAVDVLRTKGLADLAKKAGRATNEGLVLTALSEDASSAAVVEVKCETDFVAINADFGAFVTAIARQVLVNGAESIDALMTQSWIETPDLTVEGALGSMVGKLGENMGIARATRIAAPSPGLIGAYVHGVGRIGVLVEVAGADGDVVAAFAKDIAMQVAAASPRWTRREDVPADVVAHEMEIYKAQAAESGKPEPIQEKMATGRLEKFYKEFCLVEQVFVKDPEITVTQLTKKVGAEAGAPLEIVAFTRWALGETSDTGEPAPSC
jgi:elongation factor Ts